MICFGLKKIISMYDNGSVSTCGLRGRGKDILTANIIARRKRDYISNIDYKIDNLKYIPFDINNFNINNTYDNFLNNKINEYNYPYADNTDIYLSDCGIYFPSQYQNELCKKYKNFPTFLSLSRQIGLCSVNTNSQFIGRVWDKIREQSDNYIMCMSCRVFGKVVIQKVRVYERYESCEKSIPPFRFTYGLLTNQVNKTNIELAKRNYLILYGKIDTYTLIYINKSNYDTRYFKYLLGGKNEKE